MQSMDQNESSLTLTQFNQLSIREEHLGAAGYVQEGAKLGKLLWPSLFIGRVLGKEERPLKEDEGARHWGKESPTWRSHRNAEEALGGRGEEDPMI